MSLFQWVTVCLSLVLGAALPAYADGPGNTPVPASSTPAAAPVADQSGRWTKDDVATLCHGRFGTDDRSRGYQACVTRNSGKINHDKTPGEIQELDAAKGR